MRAAVSTHDRDSYVWGMVDATKSGARSAVRSSRAARSAVRSARAGRSAVRSPTTASMRVNRLPIKVYIYRGVSIYKDVSIHTRAYIYIYIYGRARHYI